MRRLKVDVDLDSGYVILKMPVSDFSEVATAAVLNCFDSINRDNKVEDLDERQRGLAYHKGLLAFICGIETLIKMQRYPNICEDPIPLIDRPTKERWLLVQQEKYERQLLDRILEQALAECRKDS